MYQKQPSIFEWFDIIYPLKEIYGGDSMVSSIWSRDVEAVLNEVRFPRTKHPFPSPEDWRDQWIYFLTVDCFNNPEAPPKLLEDGVLDDLQGGTFNGIRERLGYLQDLRVGAIWLSPVSKNSQFDFTTPHTYSIQDFLQIEPRFASTPARAEGELRALVDEAHARGIYVIFDAVWPTDIRLNALLRWKGEGSEDGNSWLKELVTEFQESDITRGHYDPVRDTLILAHEYIIAKFDIDGFRIDTLKYIERDFARIFGNAIREYTLSLGKKNFFIFGDAWDSEEKVSAFVGHYATEQSNIVGVDATLDFPLFEILPRVVKGFFDSLKLVDMFERRKRLQQRIISSHSESSKFFVTFLDNHELNERFYFPGAQEQFADQLTLGVGLLFSLQGIPCLYYGTEQGLSGREETNEAVREALWGKQNAFDRDHPFYKKIQEFAAIREEQPALRYGRQYFRPISGNGFDFGISLTPAGVLAFSRILHDREVLIVANTNTQDSWTGDVIVDLALNPVNSSYRVLSSNIGQPNPPEPVVEKAAGSVKIHEVNGAVMYGPVRTVRVKLKPMEIQILEKMS